MRVVFFHDGPFYIDLNNEIYSLSFSDDAFKRYFTVGSRVDVAMRKRSINVNERVERFSKITLNNIFFHEIPNLSSFLGQLKEKSRVKKIVNELIDECDYIIIRLPSIIGNIAFDIVKNKNKPYLVELVGCTWDSYWYHSLKGKVIAPYSFISTNRRIKQAKNVLYVTSEFLQKRYPTKGKVCNCSNVILSNMSEVNLNKRLAKINDMDINEKKVIGTIGALNVKYKGQASVIKALSELKKQGLTNFEYQLVGGGDSSYLSKLAERYGVSNQVVFIGALPHNEIFNWLETVDIYIQPSLTEGLPRGLIEAMSKGIPAFGTNVGGIPELLNDSFLIPKGKRSYIDITNKLASLNKDQLRRMSQDNFITALDYKGEYLSKKREDFFKEVFIQNQQ